MRWLGSPWGWGVLPVLIFCACGAVAPASAQLGFGQEYYRPPARMLIDTPTAGLMPAGTFETRTRVFPGGGLEVRLDIGVQDWLSIGGAYGGLQIIGDGEPEWYPEPGFFLRVRTIQETYVLPAVAIGIDTQGSGYFDRTRDRFQYKSRGVYVVASKNYVWLGDLTWHVGVSRSLEESDDKDITPFVGVRKSIASTWGLMLEYDLAVNDNRVDGAFGRGRGYLNGGLSWALAPQVEVRLVVRDMLNNSEPVDAGYSDVIVDEGWGREISFSFLESF